MENGFIGDIIHDGSMVLVYMLAWLGYMDGNHGTPHIAYMDPMGNGDYFGDLYGIYMGYNG